MIRSLLFLPPRFFLAALLLFRPLPASASPAESPLAIVEGGTSSYVVVIPDGGDQWGYLKLAAKTLVSTIKAATGCELKIAKEGEFSGGPAIYLGKCKKADSAGFSFPSAKGWECLQKTIGKDVFLAGFDGLAAGTKPEANNQILGTLKAVTLFLEQQLNVRWLMPGGPGVDIPAATDLSIPAKLDISWKPVFAYVLGRPSRDIAYSVANNFLSGSRFFSYGGHSYYAAVPKAKYAESHPEYFALIGGRRQSDKNHLCISNPEVQQLMVDELLARYDEGYDCAELSQTDGYQACECAECAKISSDPPERLWIVHRKIAEEIEKLRPGKKVMLLSYGPLTSPPKSFDKFPSNVVIQMARYSPEDFELWQPFGVEKTVYVYNYGEYQVPGFGPRRTPEYVADQVKRFVKAKVVGIYLCGGFENVGLEGPTYYVQGRMLGDPTLNWVDLCHEYYGKAFHAAKMPMTAFYNDLYARLQLYCDVQRPNIHAEKNLAKILGNPEDFYCAIYTPKLLASMTQNLDRALAGSGQDEVVKERLERVQPDFSYVKTLANVFQIYRAYRVAPSWGTFDALATALEQRKIFLDGWFDENGNAREIEKWPQVFGPDKAAGTRQQLEQGGVLNAVLGAPFKWDMARLKKLGVLPGLSEKTTTVPPMGEIKLDGDATDEAWKSLPFHELQEMSLGDLVNKSRFKIGHTSDSLNVVFECDVEDMVNFTPKTLGRDGKVTQSECVEILLDPFGDRAKYYHLVVGTTENSSYDAQRGFIEDPLHPLFAKADASWNGDWLYAVKIDRERKKWTAEIRIPYKALDVPAPTPGTTWTANFGREEYAPGTKSPIVALWCPNIESRSLHEPSVFGDLVFQ